MRARDQHAGEALLLLHPHLELLLHRLQGPLVLGAQVLTTPQGGQALPNRVSALRSSGKELIPELHNLLVNLLEVNVSGGHILALSQGGLVPLLLDHLEHALPLLLGLLTLDRLGRGGAHKAASANHIDISDLIGMNLVEEPLQTNLLQVELILKHFDRLAERLVQLTLSKQDLVGKVLYRDKRQGYD